MEKLCYDLTLTSKLLSFLAYLILLLYYAMSIWQSDHIMMTCVRLVWVSSNWHDSLIMWDAHKIFNNDDSDK